MNIKIRDIVKEILLLPFKFEKSSNDKSFYFLLQDTGYFEVYDKIAEDVILKELINNLDCIEYWFLWSKNKRDNGWYFIKKENKYIVGNISSDEQIENFEFDDVIEACSFFIKKEIESIRVL